MPAPVYFRFLVTGSVFSGTISLSQIYKSFPLVIVNFKGVDRQDLTLWKHSSLQ
jgi:hypothetical protein